MESRMTSHVAVRLEHCIIVFGGFSIIDGISQEPLPSYDIWMYNLYTEQWRKETVTCNKIVPPKIYRASGVVVGSDIYVYGGLLNTRDSLWKLSRNAKGSFAWQKAKSKVKKKSLSPRVHCTIWEFAEKLWMFGGKVLTSVNPSDYLNNYGDFGDWGENNQILCFNPSCNEWTNPQSFGDIPEPRAHHGTVIIRDKSWLYGGSNSLHGTPLDDLHELDMHSLTWTLIGKCETKMYIYTPSTLHAITENQVLVHRGMKDKDSVACDWVLDLSSMSWKKYSTPLEDKHGHFYYSFTCTRGSDSSVIYIVGKDVQYIEAEEPVPWKSIHMTFQAKSLQQLAIQTIWTHKHTLPWQETLPKKLRYLFGFLGDF